jgi:agmatinase
MSYRELFLSSQPSITTNSSGRTPIVRAFGVPYDVTTSYRPGCRFGPNSLRDAFWKIEVYDPELDVDAELLPVEDLGNLNPMPEPEKMVDSVQKVVSELLGEDSTPAILGGEHSLTYGSFSALPGNVDLLVFDAHFDLRDELYGWRLSHGTFLRRLSERFGTERFVHIGGRAASKEEWNFAKTSGMRFLPGRELEDESSHASYRKFVDELTSVYVSVDLDILDPAFAPGVGTPEPNGISSGRLLSMLRELRGKDIVGFDIVELDPPFDPSGVTSIAAASVFSTLLCLVSIQKGNR